MGLATSAGLNAYIPLLAIGLLTRYTDLINLTGGWQWLTNGWMLAVLAALLAVEIVADKIPAVDHVNDVIQTVIRPSAGGLACAATTGAQTVTVSDPSDFLAGHQWIPIVAGIVLAFTIHGMKATIRPIINAATFGVGAPIASAIEDMSSLTLALVAIVLPFVVIVVLLGLGGLFVWALRRMRQKSKVSSADDTRSASTPNDRRSSTKSG